MERRTNSIIKQIDNLLKQILPHTGEFRKEAKLYIKREKIKKKIDDIAEKYERLIASLEAKKWNTVLVLCKL